MSTRTTLICLALAFSAACASSQGAESDKSTEATSTASDESKASDEDGGDQESGETSKKEDSKEKTDEQEKDRKQQACRVEYRSKGTEAPRIVSKVSFEEGRRVERKTRENRAHPEVDAEKEEGYRLKTSTKWEWSDGRKAAEWRDVDGDGDWEQMIRWTYDDQGRPTTIEHDRATDGLGANDRDGKPERTELITWDGDRKKKVETYSTNPMRGTRRKLTAVETWEWSEGHPTRKVIDRAEDGIGGEDEDGEPDEIVELEWRNGHKQVRRTDRDADGEFETVEKWTWEGDQKVRKTLDGGKWSEPAWKPDGEPNQVTVWEWEGDRKSLSKFDRDADGEWEETTRWIYDCN